MEPKLKRQRYWVLLNSKKTPVLSSLIAREKKPKNGEWVEFAMRPCCSIKVAVGTYTSAPIFTITSNGKKTKVFVNAGTADEAVDALNEDYSALGKWSTDGEYFYLTGTVFPNAVLELIYD